MKLIFVVIHDSDADEVVRVILEKGYRVTRIASTGGFLRHGNVTLLIGVEEEKVRPIFDLIRKSCGSGDVSQHHATIFVVDMPYFEQI